MQAISNPLSPGNGDLRGVISGHFCASLHVGHARSIRPVFDYRIMGVEAQIKTKTKQISWNHFFYYWHATFFGFHIKTKSTFLQYATIFNLNCASTIFQKYLINHLLFLMQGCGFDDLTMINYFTILEFFYWVISWNQFFSLLTCDIFLWSILVWVFVYLPHYHTHLLL